MNAGEMLKVMTVVEESIWSQFGVKDMHEFIEDLTNSNWHMSNEQDIGVIINNEEYSFEVYGTSVWKNDEFTITKIYDGSGGMYCIMLSNKYHVNDEQFDEMIEKLED